MKKFGYTLLAAILMLVTLVGCNKNEVKLDILADEITMIVGDVKSLEYNIKDDLRESLVFNADNDSVKVDNTGRVEALKRGTATITASAKDYSDTILIKVIDKVENKKIILSCENTIVAIGKEVELKASFYLNSQLDLNIKNFQYEIVDGNDVATISGNTIKATKAGKVAVRASYDGVISNELVIEFVPDNSIHKIELRASKYFIVPNEVIRLTSTVYPIGDYQSSYEIISGSDKIAIDGDSLTGVKEGIATIVSKCNGKVSNQIEIEVVKDGYEPNRIDLSISSHTLNKGDTATLSFTLQSDLERKNIEYVIIDGEENAYIIGSTVYALSNQSFTIQGIIGETRSNIVIVNSGELDHDPYEDINPNDFYRNYTPATSYTDSLYRTKHHLMSGSIAKQDQKPTIAKNQPKRDGKFIRNNEGIYSNDGNTYYVVDENGDIVNAIYKGAGYVTLEEVAAHVFAFGEIPANHTPNKDYKPSRSDWGIYLRLNHTYFSGDTSRYPYEPELPDISGVGNGQTKYFEMDLGTTGTDCDPRYEAAPYNNGKHIVRGAARIVYTRSDLDDNKIIDINEKHLFYTYNHYNDFQEYLNYQGGWGEMFGNVTGGGTLSSKNDYNPTAYPEVIFDRLSNKYTLALLNSFTVYSNLYL